LDLGAIGYVPAGQAIAKAFAENSLKLIALNGILECHLKKNRESLDTEALELMTIMDDLL
jgi:phycocyanobilin lyase alpha subunit